MSDDQYLLMHAEDMALIQADMQKRNPRSLSTYSTSDLIAELKSRHELCPCLDEMEQPVCVCVTSTKSLVKEFLSRDGIESINIDCADGVATIVAVKWWEI